MADVLKRVNRTQVGPDLLGEAVEMRAGFPEKDRSAFEARTLRLLQMLDRKGFSEDRADLALAIEFRLTALARLLQQHRVRGWTLPAGDEGADFIHRDLIRAAAEEPVIEDADGQPTFNPESFRIRVLQVSEAQGEA